MLWKANLNEGKFVSILNLFYKRRFGHSCPLFLNTALTEIESFRNVKMRSLLLRNKSTFAVLLNTMANFL